MLSSLGEILRCAQDDIHTRLGFVNYYYVYILTNKAKAVFYTGITNDLRERLFQHKNEANPNSFTARYRCYYLVYYETYMDVNLAIAREKQIKGWLRIKKLALIKSTNPSLEFIEF